jgi:PAS domain S-box-containing protein
MRDEFRTKEQLMDELAQVVRQHNIESRQSPSEIKQTEDKYRDIFDDSMEGVYQINQEGRFISASPVTAHLLGYDSPEELVSTDVDSESQMYIGLEDRDALIQSLKTYGVAKNIEMKHHKKDGSVMWGLHNIRLVRDYHQDISCIEGTFKDITEQKRVKETLKESEQMFRDLAEKSLAGIYLAQDGVFQYANPALGEIMGYEIPELIGTIRLEDTILAEDRAAAMERARRRTSGEIQSVHHTFRIVTKEGKVRSVEAYGTITTYRERPALIGTMLDITERMRGQELIRQAEEMYRGVFENAVEGIFLTQPTHELMTVNSALAKIYGYDTAEEFIADLASRETGLFVSRSVYEEFFRKMHEDGYLRGFEAEQYRKDGKRIWVSFNLTPIKGAEGSIVRHIGTVVDITERKKSEEALRSSEAGLRALIGSMNDAITLVDKKGKYTTINLDNPEMLTTSLRRPFEKQLSGAVHKESAASFLAAVKKALKTRRTIHIEYLVDTRDGERWFSTAISPMTDESAVTVSRDITHLKETESELRLKSSTLEETNNALKALLRNMEGARRELEEDVVSNIRVLVMPHVNRLATQKMTSKDKVHVDAIDAGLKRVASSLLRDLSQFGLTPTEIEVAQYVRDGRTTKEIIELMGSTKDSIDIHRYHIRKKLGLNRTNINLRSHLLSFHQNI